jgi:GAF domain-containing protein
MDPTSLDEREAGTSAAPGFADVVGHDRVDDATTTTGEVRLAATLIEGAPDVEDSVEAYASTLEELVGLLLEDASLEELLTHVLELSARALSSSVAASVTVVGDDGGYTTVAASDDDAVTVDQLQYELHEGPCIDALETGSENLLADLHAPGGRWPRFQDAARSVGFGSVLAVPLRAGEATVGALNLFAAEAHGFAEEDVDLARRIAAPAASTLANARAYRRVTRLTEQLQEAMRSRAVIEQAKGMLMGQRRIDDDAAFQLLRETSQRTNRKLRDVAAAIVETQSANGRPDRSDGASRDGAGS